MCFSIDFHSLWAIGHQMASPLPRPTPMAVLRRCFFSAATNQSMGPQWICLRVSRCALLDGIYDENTTQPGLSINESRVCVRHFYFVVDFRRTIDVNENSRRDLVSCQFGTDQQVNLNC